ncbi:DNA-3-methyladenine glycosylase [Listeria welshimeri]|uniref:Putative 3-methyladenine DNA glycosylase n=1 Tax=Listeria welshimeri serovar 6b (strain ATCC 35897 / DSM 20650 / CCUG 15529 / CIP 8149 / NCTC 11857 / SLCC 5334 / V8) TaxID=386043 RepID=3MGH_LISW6|nr:DNA-3-methyladenine glycosylase [Listeria welshimeri]A0AH42.1 RecName: Full=Putative 3-methyladenine DNA glycosylase [Listeria welshimeri serovar 6b str. SLCC5334]CAK20324.1 3-methyladenine DNA glycosylase, putative [Listeria welshimeri serovar 6b str. SLCC5334]SNV21822.1 3-methyladenine DNA glycosylase [Listeria welshimeri]
MNSIIKEHYFEHKSTIELARDILGMRLVHQTQHVKLSGYIVETEAYLGATDIAAHSYRNLKTKRTDIMYQPAGAIYMYQMHRQVLLNFITMKEGVPEAVLIRAIEPDEASIPYMEIKRNGKTGSELTNGPGKLTQALGLTIKDYGKTLFNSNIWLEEAKIPHIIEATNRIGVPNKGIATHYPLRFTVKGSRYISGQRKGQILTEIWQ